MGARWTGVVVLAAGMAITAPSYGQDVAPVVARAERCLEGNAARIVAIEDDIHAAASFLVDFACAREVERAARYERNLAYVETARTISKTAKAQFATGAAKTGPNFDFAAEVDPETGDIITPPPAADGKPAMFQSMAPAMSRQAEFLGGWSVPSALRARAAELVLQARELRKDSRRR
jgi:hypothetical protein